jgi:hypothetical protein
VSPFPTHLTAACALNAFVAHAALGQYMMLQSLMGICAFKNNPTIKERATHSGQCAGGAAGVQESEPCPNRASLSEETERPAAARCGNSALSERHAGLPEGKYLFWVVFRFVTGSVFRGDKLHCS